jgi:cytidylate kinase
MIIAIDGPAASGKGTIARRLAGHLDFAHMDTGALYRLVGYHVLTAGGNPQNENDALRAALYLQKNFQPSMTGFDEIRSAMTGNAASKVGVFPSVRKALYDLQVNFANDPPDHKKGAVLDGRDIGTVICPQADVKFFITASTEVRAKRRFKELKVKGAPVHYEEVLADMQERDERDMGRMNAPLKAAEDALIIDTTEMSADEAFEQALAETLKKL